MGSTSLDEQFRSAITPTVEARVVSDGSCGMPVYETAGVVSVFSLATGVLEVPAGFAATSIATVGGASGAGAAGGAAGGGGGGGLSGVTIGAIAGGAGAAAVAGVAVSRGGSDSSPGSITLVSANPPPGSTVPVQPDGSIDLTLTVSVVYSISGSYVLHAFSDVHRANTGPACTANPPGVRMNLQSDQPSIINTGMRWEGDSLPECSRPVRVQCMVFQILEGPGQFINPLVNVCLPVNYTFVDR